MTAKQIGTDIAGLGLCLYGDCEARGAYVADPYGWANPATITVGTLPYAARGISLSPSYFRLNAGRVGVDISSATATLWSDPVAFQVNAVYADGEGQLPDQPLRVSLRSASVRLAMAVDLGRSALRIKGLSLGLLAALPVTDSDLRVSLVGIGDPIVHSHEDRDVDLTFGVHWRGGERAWFMVGASLAVVHDSVRTQSLDLTSFATRYDSGTSNVWMTRLGVSLLPFVAMGAAFEDSPIDMWLGEVRLGADVAVNNISVPGEGTRKTEVGYFGYDTHLLPDVWNPLNDCLQLHWMGGVDTDGGWGQGIGFYGNGPLKWASCNPSYSSRPIAKSLGQRLDLWSATCAASFGW